MSEISEKCMKALKIIKKHKGGISISNLAKECDYPKSNFGTRFLTPLENAGLVKRFKDGKNFMVKKVKKPKKEIAAKSEKRKLQEELSKLKQIPGIDDPEIKQKIREKVKEVIQAERKEEIKELTKPERRAKIKEAKEGLVTKKHAEWIKKSQFQKLPIGWFQYRPAKTAQFLRYLINIGISGGERYKISKTFGGMSNYRAIMNQLISFLEQK